MIITPPDVFARASFVLDSNFRIEFGSVRLETNLKNVSRSSVTRIKRNNAVRVLNFGILRFRNAFFLVRRETKKKNP